jgi:hypothetical protein
VAKEVKIFLNLSEEVQGLLEDNRIDLYDELLEEEPDLRRTIEANPEAPEGTRNLETVLLATATLVASLTPLIIHIINRFTPPDRLETWTVEDVETRDANGEITTQHKYIHSLHEQRPWTSAPYVTPLKPSNQSNTNQALPESTSQNQSKQP